VRERLLASVGGSRFDRFVVRLSDLLDLGVERVRSLLASTEDPGAWEALLPGVAVMHLPYGPGVVAADVGFVRVAAGLPFPYHKHLGEEHVLVLGGAFRDDDGRVLRAGDEDHKPAGSAHAFQVLEGEELLYLVILAGGVEFPPSPV
jgi:anti-sigma factor ChrR (cupin superfamily)